MNLSRVIFMFTNQSADSPPKFSRLNLRVYEKTWESVPAYPSPQAFALPNPKDKQRKKPTPRNIIYVRLVRRRYNTPNADVPLPYLFWV